MSFMKKLGDVFNKAGEKAGEFADYASDKANTMATQTKYKMEQQKLRGKITAMYKELGEKVYLAQLDADAKGDIHQVVAEYCEQLKSMHDQIAALDEKIAELSDNDKAPADGAEQAEKVESAAVEDAEKAVSEGFEKVEDAADQVATEATKTASETVEVVKEKTDF